LLINFINRLTLNFYQSSYLLTNENFSNQLKEPSVREQISMFNNQPIMTAPATAAPTSNIFNQPNTQTSKRQLKIQLDKNPLGLYH
jgi:hypothetical protein